MPDVQVRPDLSVQRLLGDIGHVSLDPAIQRHGQEPSRWAMPSAAAITASDHDSKAAAAYDRQRPMPLRIQDPVVAAATGFFQASKEDQREAVHELLEIAKQAGPSTEFVADYESGNYTVAFVGLTDFLLDIYGYGYLRRIFRNWRSSWKLRKTVAEKYPDKLPLYGCLHYLIGTDIRYGISRMVKHPVRRAQFLHIVTTNARKTPGGNVPAVGVNDSINMIGGPSVEAPVRFARQNDSLLVQVHQGIAGPGAGEQVLAFEITPANVQEFARDLIREGFIVQ